MSTRSVCSTCRAQFAPIRDEVMAAVARVCDSQQFILGAEVEAFERELAAMLGVAARRGRLVGDRRAAGGDDGGRHRAGRRGHHTDLLVLRHGRLRRPARRAAGVGGHRPGHVQPGPGRDDRRPLAPHEGDRSRPSLRTERRPGSDARGTHVRAAWRSSRMRRRRSARATGARASAASASSGASRSSRARTSARSATAGW